MEIIFNEKEFIEKAEKIGIKLKFNSETPGMFAVKNGKRKEFSLEELFPEVFDEKLMEDCFSIPDLVVDKDATHVE